MKPDDEAKSLIEIFIEKLGLRKDFTGQITLHCLDGLCKEVWANDKNKEIAETLNSKIY